MSKQQASIDVLEGDLAIGEFMGLPGNHLKYHKRWDYLMPVVEKIEDLGHATFITSCHVRKKLDYSMQIFEKDGSLFIDNDFGYTSKIKCVFDTVISFITWYNNTQTKKQ